METRKCLTFIAALITLIAWSQAAVSAQAPGKILVEPRLSLSEVVEKLVQKNAERAKALESYRGKRVYELEYKGFPKTLHAEMVVEMTYNAPGRKEFKIVSESGSKWIVKRVLKRLIDEETEAQGAATRLSVELSSRNYEFTSLELQTGGGGCVYVVGIQPKAANKFLYRGRIWVDDRDFAVCRIEAEPAKNPSMWITKTEIHHDYQKFEDFWLPVKNESVSSLRLGGRATLTITYQDYEINGSHVVKDNSASSNQ
jgi:outer membrane lipoprotein-sorting protein